MNKIRTKQKGFTIVELLIVIVVIGILAAITIVAYNGIQQRAANTQTASALEQYVKAFSLYATDNGLYPAGGGCLGDQYTNSRCLSAGGTAACYGLGASTYNAAANSALKQYMGGRLPMPNIQQVSCGGTTYTGAYYWSNPAAGGKDTILIMILKGSGVSCPDIGGTANKSAIHSGGGARCGYSLPTL